MNRVKQHKSPGGRGLYTILFAVAILITISGLQSLGGKRDLSHRLHGRSLQKRDEECRLVHLADDKCAFVKANCPDEEAGLISYLQFYYCSLPHAQPLAFVILVIWIGSLFSTIGIAASDYLCINLSTISSILGMSESLAGVTLLAFGNGSTDVFSTFAAMSSHSGSLAVGELIGAASFITAVVAGSMAIARPFKVAKKSFVRDIGFFVVAACFSMLFLSDGSLHTWECACMVGFYLFYVAFVVTWHWWQKRRRRQKLRQTAASLHHHIPSTQELEIRVEDDDEGAPAGETSNLLRPISEEDFAGLEGNLSPAWKASNNLDDDDVRRRGLADLSSNMRVSRPARGERRNTMTPIRPSLVGALEFRSVLHSLERRSSHVLPIGLRSYSDDPSEALPQQDGFFSAPNLIEDTNYLHLDTSDIQPPRSIRGRGRAVSANDAAGLRIEDTNFQSGDGAYDALIPGSGQPSAERSPYLAGQRQVPMLSSPQLFLSPPGSSQASRDTSPAPRQGSPDRLAPPGGPFRQPDYNVKTRAARSPTMNLSPETRSNSDVPRISIPRSGSSASHSSSPPPPYRDSPTQRRRTHSRAPSIRLPPASLSPESTQDLPFVSDDYMDESEGEERTFKWWPYKYLPSPQAIARKLWPTMYGWKDKSILNKILGLTTAPSVFLLAITVPVVEESEQDCLQPDPVSGIPTPRAGSESSEAPLIQVSNDVSNSESHHDASQPPTRPQKPTLNIPNLEVTFTDGIAEPIPPRDWSRWLVCVQLFTAPLFIVLVVWANLDDDHDTRSFIWFTLCSLLFSLVGLLILLVATVVEHAPKYYNVLSILGFIVAIAWISTIANEVVGVLKTMGVILQISDAILGLTIFAVGNSLGDLVADITVARLGFPVMALSACFGGPMLNILLGIGVSGLYITIRHGAKYHHKHPDRPIAYKPYQIDISTTLLISGITLLVTLVGLLIVVPLNGWKMDRKIGIGLISLWTLSTLGNVIAEVLGWGGDISVLS